MVIVSDYHRGVEFDSQLYPSNFSMNILFGKDDWDFWITDLVKNPDETDI